MGEIVNLRRVKKQRARVAEDEQAAANRVRHGRTKAEREAERRDNRAPGDGAGPGTYRADAPRLSFSHVLGSKPRLQRGDRNGRLLGWKVSLVEMHIIPACSHFVLANAASVWCYGSMTSWTPAPVPATIEGRFELIMSDLRKEIFLRGWQRNVPLPLLLLVWSYFNRLRRRFLAVVAKVRAGTLPAPREPRASLRGWFRPGQSARALATAAGLWLVGEAGGPAAALLRDAAMHFMLHDPDMKALLGGGPRNCAGCCARSSGR